MNKPMFPPVIWPGEIRHFDSNHIAIPNHSVTLEPQCQMRPDESLYAS